MKYVLPIIVIALAIAGIVFFRVFNRPQRLPVAPEQSRESEITSQGNWETKTDEQSGVAVSVTPVDMSPQSDEWTFHIAMDTHSVELDQDLTKVAVLVDSQGREYMPLRWEGPGPGGHHREGALVFQAIRPASSFVVLKIKNVGGVSERSFTWNME